MKDHLKMAYPTKPQVSSTHHRNSLASPSQIDQSLISIISSISSEHKNDLSRISHNTTYDKGFIEESK
jgi:hypothetical protein